MNDSNNPATPSPEQTAQAERARLPRTLMGGTRAMRAAGKRYLPRLSAESQQTYDNRLVRSTLFNAFRKTVADMTGKVFTKPIVLSADVPAQLRTFAENIDLAGRHLNVFARDAFNDAMQTGIGYILTEMPPKVTRQDGLPATLADEQQAGIRPYLVYIPVEKLIGWKSTQIDGVETLTQIRILESVTEPDGDFHEKEIEQVRIIEPGRWQTFRKSAAKPDEWVEHKAGLSSLDKIPLAPVYIHRTGFMSGAPPLEDLADLNVAHWQSQSDQRNILTIARVPILFGTGMNLDDVLEIGASSMIRTSDPNAKLQYVEHSGAAISAGDKDLQNLEFQMQNMGLQLLVPQVGQTATGEIRDNAKENSPLAMMAHALADALEQSLGFMAEYLGLGEDKGGSVEVNTDFGLMPQGDLQTVLNATSAGHISRQTFWAELKRRNVLAESFDPEVERHRIDSEAPVLGGGFDLDRDE